MLRHCIVFLLTLSSFATAQTRKTTVSIKGDDFYINNEITLKGKTYNGMRLEGLLPNSRMVQGIFDDLNPETRSNWKYPDTGVWDADRNTNEFIAAMPSWREHGLLAITLNLQGGSPYGYSGQVQNWLNSAFRADGSLDPAFMNRLERILNRADELGMVVILGYFYFGQDQNLTDEKAIKTATRNATQWLLDKGYRNVLVEVNNECDINSPTKKRYDHAILDVARVHELITQVRSMQKKGRRLLVSTSFQGGTLPTDNVLKAVDYVLIHGNSVKDPAKITSMVKSVRANASYKSSPIVFNEDDHFNFDQPINNFMAATEQHASWGYFDYRMKDESFQDGYQSMPADWGITSERKKSFFGLLKKMTQ
ncbi:hypothetical protein GCM10028807_47860 [Spirosoma daeguense]